MVVLEDATETFIALGVASIQIEFRTKIDDLIFESLTIS